MEFPLQAASKAPYSDQMVRRHKRVLFSVPIALRHLVAGGVHTAHGVSLDISECGMGALVEGSLNVGDTVAIDMDLPGTKLSTVAIVRHYSNNRSGFEFLGLSPAERLQLQVLASIAPPRVGDSIVS